MAGLKANSKAVLDIIATQKKRNAAQAYREVHPDVTENTAKSNAYQLLAKPAAQIYLQEHTNKARETVVELLTSRKDETRLNAAKDILDRNYGRALQRQEVTTTGVTLTIDLTSSLSTTEVGAQPDTQTTP